MANGNNHLSLFIFPVGSCRGQTNDGWAFSFENHSSIIWANIVLKKRINALSCLSRDIFWRWAPAPESLMIGVIGLLCFSWFLRWLSTHALLCRMGCWGKLPERSSLDGSFFLVVMVPIPLMSGWYWLVVTEFCWFPNLGCHCFLLGRACLLGGPHLLALSYPLDWELMSWAVLHHCFSSRLILHLIRYCKQESWSPSQILPHFVQVTTSTSLWAPSTMDLWRQHISCNELSMKHFIPMYAC